MLILRSRTISSLRGAALAALSVGWAAVAVACGNGNAPSPFVLEDGGTTLSGAGGAGGSGSTSAGEGGGSDPSLGGPCTKQEQCDDGIDCTFDQCDLAIERCRYSGDDSACQNGLYCDGAEVCNLKLGCRSGEPEACSDALVCTIDACDEATHTCVYAPRDVDEDGDPDIHCFPGNDCNDTDPTVSSLLPEVCANAKDDNCDGVIDEASCSTPQHDTCADPLDISAPGTYAMDTTAATFNYASSCGLANQAASRDVVAAILLPAGPPIDVEVTARTPWPGVAVTLAGQCGDPASEIACGGTFPSPQGGNLAKLLARGLGSAAQATAYPVYVTTDYGIPITVDVQFLPAQPAPTNETCGTATPIVAGVPTIAQVIGTVKDLSSNCTANTGDLVYSFTLAAPQNVEVYATSVDGDGQPSISLRGPGCALLADEITCQTAANPHLYWQSLPAGTYYVAVAASAPTDVSVTLELTPPTPPAPDESCSGAPILVHNQTIDVPMAGHQDDIQTGCIAGAVDAAYQLDLAVASDVLLIERIAQGDSGAVELSLPACGVADLLSCGAGAPSPLRSAKHNVPAGEYRAIVESSQAQAVQLTALTRPAVAPVLVPFADGCGDAFDIPETGGIFQGNTANALANLNAGCDQGNLPQGGAKDQLLRLVLSATKRVVLDMNGSTYTTLLDVRQGPSCPGTEVVLACSVGYYATRSFLDLTLAAGTYFIQIDGFNLDSGPWFLDVHVVDP